MKTVDQLRPRWYNTRMSELRYYDNETIEIFDCVELTAHVQIEQIPVNCPRNRFEPQYDDWQFVGMEIIDEEEFEAEFPNGLIELTTAILREKDSIMDWYIMKLGR